MGWRKRAGYGVPLNILLYHQQAYSLRNPGVEGNPSAGGQGRLRGSFFLMSDNKSLLINNLTEK